MLKKISFTFFIAFINVVNAQRNDTIKKIPDTFVEVVEQITNNLSEVDKSFVRDLPKSNLIMFHFGWAMGIRNGYLYRNKKIIADMEKNLDDRNYGDRLSPDIASGIIIKEIWHKLNKEQTILDYETVEPEKYFDFIWTSLQKSKETNDIGRLKTLPDWLFIPRSYFDTNNRNELLLKEALVLAKTNDEKSFLGVLYLVYYSKNIKEVNNILHDKLSDDGLIELPTYVYKTLKNRMLIKHPIVEEIPAQKVIYSWHKLSMKTFVLMCLNSLYKKDFKKYEDYEKWELLKKENYLMYWKFKDTITKADFNTLIKEPRKLLEILILSESFIDKGNAELPEDILNKIDYHLIEYLGITNKKFENYPYHKSLDFDKYLYSNENISIYRSINSVSLLAKQIDIEEIFDILDSKSIDYYNKNLKTDDLLAYEKLGAFILASQYKRLIDYSNKEKVMAICFNFYEKYHVSWSIKFFLTDLLFQIDVKKANSMFSKYFIDDPETGSFTRNGILKSIIKYDFDDNKDFIEKWYWVVHYKNFNYNPKEKDLILDLLKEKNTKTRQLYQKIAKDKRFKK